MIKNPMIYAVPVNLSLQELGELLADRLEVKVERIESIQHVYLDTFDWRLYRSGMVLEIECRGAVYLLLWRELNSGRVLLSRTVRRAPKSAADFSDAGKQSLLKQVIGRRSLLPHAVLCGDTERLLLLDKNEKTVMRIELRRDQVLSPQGPSPMALGGAIYLFPYRGYEEEFRARLRLAVGDGALSPIRRDPLLSALDALEITPGQYTSRPAFTLDNKRPALEVLVQILKSFLQVMESNIAGAREDDDPEYLHDFLVAVRRTMIFLHSFADIFPANNLRLIEHGFQWIEQEATPIRDLDIYMTIFRDFESRVDADHRQALQSLYKFLRDEKRRELRRMRTSLDSPRYFRLIETWSDFLQICMEYDPLPKDANKAIGKLVRKRIGAIYSEFVHGAKGLTQDSGFDEMRALHQISKRLGYHMDVFGSLFPDREMGKLLKAQARVQARLNQFRDMDLQYTRLREYKSRMKKVQAVRKISLEAVEQLIADRRIEKDKARKKALKQVGRFTRKEMRKRFKSLLAAPVKGGGA